VYPNQAAKKNPVKTGPADPGIFSTKETNMKTKLIACLLLCAFTVHASTRDDPWGRAVRTDRRNVLVPSVNVSKPAPAQRAGNDSLVQQARRLWAENQQLLRDKNNLELAQRGLKAEIANYAELLNSLTRENNTLRAALDTAAKTALDTAAKTALDTAAKTAVEASALQARADWYERYARSLQKQLGLEPGNFKEFKQNEQQ